MQKALPIRVALFFAAKNDISTIIRIFARVNCTMTIDYDHDQFNQS